MAVYKVQVNKLEVHYVTTRDTIRSESMRWTVGDPTRSSSPGTNPGQQVQQVFHPEKGYSRNGLDTPWNSLALFSALNSNKLSRTSSLTRLDDLKQTTLWTKTRVFQLFFPFFNTWQASLHGVWCFQDRTMHIQRASLILPICDPIRHGGQAVASCPSTPSPLALSLESPTPPLQIHYVQTLEADNTFSNSSIGTLFDRRSSP